MKRNPASKSSPLCAVPNSLPNPFRIIQFSIVGHLIRVERVNTSRYTLADE
jgi:hypothetical protein